MTNLRQNESFQAVRGFLESEGIPFRADETGKHPKVHFDTPYGERFIVLPATSSDHRSAKNALSDLQRAVRGLSDPAKKGATNKPASLAEKAAFEDRCQKTTGKTSETGPISKSQPKSEKVRKPIAESFVENPIPEQPEHRSSKELNKVIHELSASTSATLRLVDMISQLIERLDRAPTSTPAPEPVPEEPQETDKDELVSREELPALVGMRENSLYSARNNGWFPDFVKVEGRRQFWKKRDIEAWKERRDKYGSSATALGPDYVNLNETAAILGMQVSSLRNQIHNKKFPRAKKRRGHIQYWDKKFVDKVKEERENT